MKLRRACRSESGSLISLHSNNPCMWFQVARAVVATLILLATSEVFAVRRERTITTWRPLHYSVNITLNDRLSQIVSAETAVEVLVLKKLETIDFDFGDLTTDRVAIDDSPVRFSHRNGSLVVSTPKPLNPGTRITVTIAYHGEPKDGLILTKDKDGRPSAIGDNWPNRVHQWIPSLDHPSAKATVTFTVTTAPGQLVVANGTLDRVETVPNGNRIWTYNETVAVPPYCMIIAVGDFARLQPLSSSGYSLSYYVPRSDDAVAEKGFSSAAPALQMFSQLVAPYPYEKLALIVGATRFGGMENSSAIVFTPTLFNRNGNADVSRTFGIPRGTVSLVAHEIAHQWFGDSVTESTWSDLWLSEGFATYFAGLFLQKHDGEEAFQNYMQSAAEKYFAYEKKMLTPVFDPETEDLFKLLNPNNYEKGAWILHMLRSRLGDEKFFRGIRTYFQAHKNSVASSEDLRAALEQASATNLRPFFRRWVYDSGHPKYDVTWSWNKKRRGVTIQLSQVQDGDLFEDPVEILLVGPKSSRTITITPRVKQTVQFVSSNEQPTRIQIDPRGLLLKEVRIKG
ncbi:MAG TPA: M1 family aminopeptidase [Pyrinomonadaceae bacterium]